MNRRRVDPLIVAGVVLLALTVALATLGARTDDADHGRTASVYDAGAGGAATLRRLLEATGTPTTTIEGDRFVPRVQTARALFLMRPTELITVQDVAALRGYLDEGGTVIVAHDFELWLQPLLETFDVRFGAGAPTGTTLLAGPLFAVPAAHQIQSEPGRTLRPGPAWDVIGTDGGAPTVAMRTEGKGTLIVIGTTTPFLTASLSDADNARFAVDLVSTARAARGVVAFDEYHHGVHPAPTILALVERTWPGRALVFGLIVVFLFLALTGRRLGPPQPLDPRPPRSSLEYVRGFAGLVRRAGRQEVVRDRLRGELHAGLARATSVDPATPFAEIVERVRGTSVARAEEAAALDARLRGPLREGDLVRSVARVAALLREEGS